MHFKFNIHPWSTKDIRVLHIYKMHLFEYLSPPLAIDFWVFMIILPSYSSAERRRNKNKKSKKRKRSSSRRRHKSDSSDTEEAKFFNFEKFKSKLNRIFFRPEDFIKEHYNHDSIDLFKSREKRLIIFKKL